MKTIKLKIKNLTKYKMIGGARNMPPNVEIQLPVFTPEGTALINLYEVNYPAELFSHQVLPYMLKREDGTKLNINTVPGFFISDLPSIKKYEKTHTQVTFNVTSKINEHNGQFCCYIVTRLS